MNELYAQVRVAVHSDWDPIGVSRFTKEMGEYDSYVARICELLQNGATVKEVFRYLWIVETKSMGLQGDQEATKKFAARLCELKPPRRKS